MTILKDNEIGLILSTEQKNKKSSVAENHDLNVTEFINERFAENYGKTERNKFKNILDGAIEIICAESNMKIDLKKIKDINEVIQFISSRFDESALNSRNLVDFYFNIINGDSLLENVNKLGL